MLVVLPFCLMIGTASGAFPGRQVITSDMLKNAGVVRITDLLLLADSWRVSTIDGYTWRAAVNGLNAFDDQAWIIMLDGQRMDLKAIDIINLNAVPVDLSKIDSVEIISVPRLHHGEFTDKGLIHIHTQRPGIGVSALGHYFAGNETGDPGPYIYTNFQTPNVDRIGFDESLSIDVARNNWFAQAYLLWQAHTFNDYAIHRRVLTTISEWAGLNLWSAFCRLGLVSARGQHELTAGYSFGDKQRVFFKPLGREIPTAHHVPHFGLSGFTRSFSGNVGLEYRLQISRNSLWESPNLLNFSYDWSVQTITACAQGIFNGDKLRGTIGAGFDHYGFSTQPAIHDPSYTISKLFGDIRLMQLGSVNPSLGVMLLRGNGQAALKTSLSTLWAINPSNSVGFTFSFSQRLIEEDNNLWYWVRQGYGVFENNSIEHSLYGNLDQSSRITADATWSTVIMKHLTATADIFYRHLEGVYLERLSYQYESDICAFTSPVYTVTGDIWGKLGGVALTINHALGQDFTQRIHYAFQTILDGDPAFGDAYSAIPAHTASYQISWAPFDNIVLWARFYYRSSSIYHDYQDVGVQICPRPIWIQPVYSPEVSGFSALDLSMKKWFWKRRVSGQIILRNIMNEDLRYHTVGAGFSLSMLIQVNVLLNVPD